MTQTIIYMRHAEYSRDLSSNSGKLTPRGIKMAEFMAKDMSSKGLKPDVCVFSNAIRAIQTKNVVLETAKFGAIQEFEEKNINECWDFEPMVDVINLFPDARCILLVGHNPIMGALASLLLRNHGIFTPGSYLVVEYSAKISSRNICNSAEAKVLFNELAQYD